MPPMAYCGGKTRLARRIAGTFVPHDHYVEPYAGSLAVLLAKEPSKIETANDLDGDIMTFWRVLRDQPTELARLCALTPHSRAEHQAAYEVIGTSDLERARRVWVLLTQGRGGRLTRTGWRQVNNPSDIGKSMAGYLRAYVNRMEAAAQRLRNVSLECRPALELISAYGKHEGVLLYVDPPYLGETRNSSGYRHEMLRPAEHEDLASALNECKSAVVLSGYRSPLYDDLFAGWHCLPLAAATTQGGKSSARTEVLWSNRPFATQAALPFGEAS